MCNQTYTPTDAINAVFNHYVNNGGMPAVDDENRKLYLLDGIGCAVTVLATPEMRRMLALTNHHSSPACVLHDQNINLVEIIDAPDWCAGTIRRFMQEIQNAHDTAADEYANAIKAGKNQGLAHDLFCSGLTRELSNVCNSFDLTDLGRDLRLRDRPKRFSMTDTEVQAKAAHFTEQGELVTV